MERIAIMVETAKKWIKDHYDEMIKDLETLIACKSVKTQEQEGMPFGKGVNDALIAYGEMAKKLGFNFVNVDGYAGYFDYEDKGTLPEIGILSHLDVVPPVGFTNDPYTLVIEKGKMIARGIVDDKGPTIIVLYALAALKASGFVPTKNIRMIVGCNEESGWKGIEYYKTKCEMPKVGYSPDADYPLINSEKGIMTVKLSKKIYLSGITKIKGGLAANMVPQNCTFTVNATKQEEFLGKACHASIPNLGENAIVKGLKSLSHLDKELLKLYAIFTTPTGKGLNLTDEKISSNLGMIDYDRNMLNLTMDIRYPKHIKTKDVQDKIQETFSDYEIEYAHLMEPHFVDNNHELCTKLLQAYTTETGKKGVCKEIGGGTYSRAFEVGVAFGCAFEEDEMVAHMADEYMSENGFNKNIDIQLRGIYNLCK